MLKSSADHGFQVVHLEVGRDLTLKALPGIAWAFDQFDGIAHTQCLIPNSEYEVGRKDRGKTAQDRPSLANFDTLRLGK